MLSAFYNLKAIFYNPPNRGVQVQRNENGGGGAMHFVENTHLFIKIKI